MLVTATAANLSARGIPLGFGFLFAPANFSISETLLPFKPQDPNWWAIVVGIANTLFVSAVVIVASSILGCLSESDGSAATAGRRRDARLGGDRPEHARHYPADLRLCVVVEGPAARARGGESAARRLPVPARLALPMIDVAWPLALVITLIACAAAVWAARGLAVRRQEATGRRPAYVAVAVAASIAALAVTAVLSGVSATVEWPRLGRTNVIGGLQLTPELTTILVGLTLYTTGFIAEIVRGGILAIGKGQWEAARSLGLTQGSILGSSSCRRPCASSCLR